MIRLVLVGAGHSHAQVLKEVAHCSAADVQTVLVSPESETPYSGMIPGWLAGYYDWRECCIDFDRLCRRANTVFLKDEVVSLDLRRQEVVTAGGGRISYDVLSLDIGSTVSAPSGEGVAVLPVRPLSRLREFWEDMQRRIQVYTAGAEFRVVVVGGGAAGVESMLAIHGSLTRMASQVRFRFALAAGTQDIVPAMAPGAARRLKKHLDERGIEIVTGFSALRIDHGRVIGSDRRSLQADAVLWATGAEAFAWPGKAGIMTDGKGFGRVDGTLRSRSHPNVFAAGDCAGFEPSLPKAGVYAVRMGPVLADNLFNFVAGRPLRRYVPQKRYMTLIGTGDGSAVAAWDSLAWEGRWIWRWKQQIDRRFLARYNESA